MAGSILGDLATGSTTDTQNPANSSSQDNYHKICDQREPPGLSKCESAKFRLNRAQQCFAARESYTQKNFNGTYDTGHAQQMQQLLNAINNAQKDVDRFCGKSCH